MGIKTGIIPVSYNKYIINISQISSADFFFPFAICFWEKLKETSIWAEKTKCDPVAHDVKLQRRGHGEAANPLRHGCVCLQLLYPRLKMTVVITDNFLILHGYTLHLHAS